MKSLRALALALCTLVVPLSVAAQSAPVSGPTTFTFSAASQSNVWTCNKGQSSFSLIVPAGFTGTFTVTVAQTSGGTYVNPPWSYTPGVATYSNTLINSGALTVNLGSNGYVKVADTSYTSGSVTVTGSCSGAVAVIPPQISGVNAGTNIVVSGAPTPTVATTMAPTFTTVSTTGSIYTGSANGAPSSISSGDGVFTNSTASGQIWLCGSATVKPFCNIDFDVGGGTNRVSVHGHLRVLSDIDTYGGVLNLNPNNAPAAPTLSYVAGGSLPATTYYVRVTPVSLVGEGFSGNASTEVSLAVPANNLLVVTTQSNVASTSSGHSPQTENIYVSTSSGIYTTGQQATNITPGSAWTEPSTGLVVGAALPSTDNSAGYVLSSHFGLNQPVCSSTIPGYPSGFGSNPVEYFLTNTCSSTSAAYQQVSAGTITDTGLSASSRVCTDASKNLLSCTAHVKIAMGLGFYSGTVSASTTYPYQPVVGYTNGEITGMRAACGTADNGTTVVTLYKNGTSVGTLTLSTSQASSVTFGSPVTIAAGDILNISITTAGTGSNCGFIAEGQQDAF